QPLSHAPSPTCACRSWFPSSRGGVRETVPFAYVEPRLQGVNSRSLALPQHTTAESAAYQRRLIDVTRVGNVGQVTESAGDWPAIAPRLDRQWRGFADGHSR